MSCVPCRSGEEERQAGGGGVRRGGRELMPVRRAGKRAGHKRNVPGGGTTVMELNWYEDFFQGVALDLWRRAISADQTKAEAAFLAKALKAKRNGKLLDVPCGNGRHSLELAKRGFRMTGLDISEEFIQEAQNLSKAQGALIEWVLGDMCQIQRISEFDGAFCLGNSFGYFDYQDMLAFLRRLARALKPGARFVFDSHMAAESILPNLREREWFQVDDILLAMENSYRVELGCVETQYTFVKSGKVENRTSLHWVYTLAEIRRMLENAGFSILETHGGIDGRPFAFGSPLLVVTAQKESQ